MIAMHLSIMICAAIAAVTVGILVQQVYSNRRIEHRTFDDSLRAMERVTFLASELITLPLEQRAARRREIAQEILLDITFVYCLVSECWRESPSGNAEVVERTAEVMHRIIKLRGNLLKTLFLLRFRPKLVIDCRRIFEALEGHHRVWIAFLQLLKAKYPDRYGDLSISD